MFYYLLVHGNDFCSIEKKKLKRVDKQKYFHNSGNIAITIHNNINSINSVNLVKEILTVSKLFDIYIEHQNRENGRDRFNNNLGCRLY